MQARSIFLAAAPLYGMLWIFQPLACLLIQYYADDLLAAFLPRLIPLCPLARPFCRRTDYACARAPGEPMISRWNNWCQRGMIIFHVRQPASGDIRDCHAESVPFRDWFGKHFTPDAHNRHAMRVHSCSQPLPAMMRIRDMLISAMAPCLDFWPSPIFLIYIARAIARCAYAFVYAFSARFCGDFRELASAYCRSAADDIQKKITSHGKCTWCWPASCYSP